MKARTVGKYSVARIGGGQNVKDMQITDKEGGGDDKKPFFNHSKEIEDYWREKKRDPIGSRLPSLGTSKTSWLPATCRHPVLLTVYCGRKLVAVHYVLAC